MPEVRAGEAGDGVLHELRPAAQDVPGMPEEIRPGAPKGDESGHLVPAIRHSEAVAEGDLVMNAWESEYGIRWINEQILAFNEAMKSKDVAADGAQAVGASAPREARTRGTRPAAAVRVIVLLTIGRTRLELALDTARPHVVVHRWTR